MKKIGGLILAVIILVAGYKLFNRPTTGKISYQSPVVAKPTKIEYIRYDGQELSFAYENKYGLQGQEGNWTLVGKAGVTNQIVIMIGPARSADIEEVSGVLLRRVKRMEYSEEKIDWEGTEGGSFTKKEGFERTAFFVREGKAVSVAMTANSNDKDKNEAEFLKLVESMTLRGGPEGN